MLGFPPAQQILFIARVWVDADGTGPGNPDQVWTVFDGVNPYMDFDGAGQLQTRYLYGPGIDDIFARIGTSGDPQWYLTDRLGSVRQIVDAEGSILDVIVYDSFGNVLSESNPSQGDRFKFTGREFRPDLGIYYYRARWYDPSTGRFISQDPIGFTAGDTNLYRYVGNGPGDATDPLGQSPTLISGGIGTGVGAVVGGAFGWWNGTGFWSGAGHGFVVGGVTGLTAGAGAWLFGGTATTTIVGGTVGGMFGGVASDAVGQGVEIGLGWREEYSFFQSGVSGLFGGIFGAGPTIWKHCRNFRKPGIPPKLPGQWDFDTYPKPPGWNSNWQWGPATGETNAGWRWFDPHGGEWRWHSADQWHPNSLWDYNAWTQWNSRWQNVHIQPAPMPRISTP